MQSTGASNYRTKAVSKIRARKIIEATGKMASAGIAREELARVNVNGCIDFVVGRDEHRGI